MRVKPLISVIVTVYQMQDYLPRCVDSLLAQTWTNLEILLVDDGSYDKSPMLCDEYADKDTRVRILHVPNGGVSRARNIGLAEATAGLIAFVDADDWLEPNCLCELYELLQDAGVKMAACNHWIEPPKGEPQTRFPTDDEPREIMLRDAYCGVLYHGRPDISPWGKLYRREIFEGIFYPEGHVFEDTYCIAKLLKNAGGVVYTPKPLYHYLFREQSISKHESNEKIFDFERAVEHMIMDIRAVYPDLEGGCERRRMHAWLSMRRFYVACPPEEHPKRDALEKKIRRNARKVLFSGDTPRRDRLGILAILLHSFDRLWMGYSRIRWR